jgi:two-component system response regulator DesR
MMLETRGWRCVAHAANPLSEKEAAAMGDRIDAALLDLNAGEANGLTVAAELRRLNPALPIVVMTGNSDAGLRDRVAALRNSAVLQKPFSIATLEAALATAFSG